VTPCWKRNQQVAQPPSQLAAGSDAPGSEAVMLQRKGDVLFFILTLSLLICIQSIGKFLRSTINLPDHR
jgi:hypothetical protein